MSDNNISNNQCQHFNFCGGCKYDNINSDDYKKSKKAELTKQLYNIDTRNLANIQYLWLKLNNRRKAVFHINKSNKLGFFKERSKDIVVIKQCLVLEPEIMDLKFAIEEFLKSQPTLIFTQVIITNFDNGLDILFNITNELDFLQQQKLTEFALKNNVNLSYNYKGSTSIILQNRLNQIEYPRFKVNLASNIFLQASKDGLKNIIAIIRDFLINNESSTNKILDLYCGFGAYSFAIADLATNILAIDGDQNMIKLLKENALKNGIDKIINCQNQDLFINPITSKIINNYDLAIINPARNGASTQIEQIANSQIKHLIYISCNPISFNKDSIFLLKSEFKITKLFCLDQFIGSKHLEIIAIFSRS